MLGSEGLHTFDMSGQSFLWVKNFGVLDSGFLTEVPAAQWEYASSPVIHNGVIVIQADVQKDSFLAAFDVTTGRELWRTPRQGCPHVGHPDHHHEVGGRAQILVNGWRHIGAHTASQRARKSGDSRGVATSGPDTRKPVVGFVFFFITNAHGFDVACLRRARDGDRRYLTGAQRDNQ